VSGRKCPGLHCPGCGDGLGLISLVVALAVIGAVIHAIWRTVVEAAAIAAVTVLGAAGLAAIGGIGYLVYRVRQTRPRQNRPRRPVTARPVYWLPPETRPGLSEPYKPAIAPPRVISAEQLAAIVTRREEKP
jgi:hypothetical protein